MYMSRTTYFLWGVRGIIKLCGNRRCHIEAGGKENKHRLSHPYGTAGCDLSGIGEPQFF